MADNPGPSWQATVVALAFIGLVGFCIWLAVIKGPFDEIWGGFGTIIGVITGAIPSFFFYRASQNAQDNAQKANRRATAYAAAADPTTAQQIEQTLG